METVVHTLQEEIPNLPNLSQEKEDSLFLAIAGLKQVMCVVGYFGSLK